MSAEEIVGKMMEKDAFSQWLGIEVMAVKPGFAQLKMKVRSDMVNGFDIAHGGISFSLADSALAFASNGHGQISVSTQTAIQHLEPIHKGDSLIAVADEIKLSNKLGHYRVTVRNQDEKLVADFQGVVYRTPKSWT